MKILKNPIKILGIIGIDLHAFLLEIVFIIALAAFEGEILKGLLEFAPIPVSIAPK